MNKNSKVGSWKHSLKWAGAILAIVAIGWSILVPKPVKIDVGIVTRGSMQMTVDDDGETRVRERYVISAPLAGRLLRVRLDPGDAVKTGDVMVTIDPVSPDLIDPRTRAQAEAIVRAAESAVGRAKTELAISEVNRENADKSFRRFDKLSKSGAVAESDFEEAERALFTAQHAQSAAEASVAIAEFELEQARAAFLRTGDTGEREAAEAGDDWNFIIHAPVDGTILRLYEESSHVVSMGTPLLELGDPRDLEIKIDVLSQDAVKIRPGQRVIVQHWGGEKPLEGYVRLVEPSGYTKVSALGVDEQRVDVIVDLDSLPESGEQLGDGFRIEASVVIWESEDVLQVSAGSLFREDGLWCVFVIQEGKATKRVVELGFNNGNVAQVLSGLDRGTEVVLHPGDRISEGIRVSPRE